MDSLPKIPDIPEQERTGWVVFLLELCAKLRTCIQKLKDENALLKKQKIRPTITPSLLNQEKKTKEKSKRPPHSGKRSKKTVIHYTVKIRPTHIPEESRFKGYQNYKIQDIEFQLKNTLYRLERWQMPDGRHVVGQLPNDVAGHFGADLRSFILYQYYHAHVTQPLILELLHEWGIDISAGQINNILIANKEEFHSEKMGILEKGLKFSRYIHTDDTGARHNGKNGYCTHIGNEHFAWFASTQSKSRINFLELLRAGHEDYVLNTPAFEYMQRQKLPRDILQKLEALSQNSFDAAGKFNILLHILCWIHAERTIKKQIGFNEEQRQALDGMLDQIWDFYRELKSYKLAPSSDRAMALTKRFDEIFLSQTCYVSLNKALNRIYKNKDELLRVLADPNLPLNNNLSEGDIRDYVKIRKISGSTRSAEGRRSRDTFASLKKTSRKLKVSFWLYIQDRIYKRNKISLLGDIIPSGASP